MYTLTRHSMWTVPHFPRFRNGLQPVGVDTRTAIRVLRLGGVLLPDEPTAWDAAERFMYPDGDSAVPPNPDGTFRAVPFCRLPLFIPGFSRRLVAV